MVDCQGGQITIAGRVIHDNQGEHFGVIPVHKALEQSSDVGAIKMALNTSTNVLKPSDPLSVTWSVTSNQTTHSDWIGLYPVGAPVDSNAALWLEPTQGSPTGTLQLKMPEVEGNFEFRYFSGSGPLVLKAKSTAVLAVNCVPWGMTRSNIKHLVLIVQENHSFDNIFGKYCKAATGSNPTCNEGPECCEEGPAKDPGSGFSYFIQTDSRNARYDPNHDQSCEISEMDGGKMDHYLFLAKCGNWLENFAYADASTVSQYWQYAENYALADRYFQPIAGASSSNDMYFARAAYVFTDNKYLPAGAVGTGCAKIDMSTPSEFTDPNIGDMLRACNIPFEDFRRRICGNESRRGQMPSKTC